MLPLVIGYFLIFFARVIDVSMGTLRVLFLVRGRRLLAATIGLFEVTIYLMALGYVVGRLNDPFSVFIYALGFATGNVVGSIIEEKVALGQVIAQVITLKEPLQLAESLRASGFGVTITEGQGREGCHPILHIGIPRKQLKTLYKTVNEWDKDAFVVFQEARSIYGGFCQLKRKAK